MAKRLAALEEDLNRRQMEVHGKCLVGIALKRYRADQAVKDLQNLCREPAPSPIADRRQAIFWAHLIWMVGVARLLVCNVSMKEHLVQHALAAVRFASDIAGCSCEAQMEGASGRGYSNTAMSHSFAWRVENPSGR